MDSDGGSASEQGKATAPTCAVRAKCFPYVTAFLVLCGTLNTVVTVFLCSRASFRVTWFKVLERREEGGWQGKWRRSHWVNEARWVESHFHFYQSRVLTSEETRHRALQCEEVGGKYVREIVRPGSSVERTVLSHDEYLTYIAGRPLTDEEKATMRNDIRRAIRHNNYWDWMHGLGFLLLLLLLPSTLGVLFNVVWHWSSRYRYLAWGMVLLTALNWALVQ
jgi:hypothetical protein